MTCKLCLAEPHRDGCPVEGNDLLARQLRYLPPDLVAEARVHHFPELRSRIQGAASDRLPVVWSFAITIAAVVAILSAIVVGAMWL